MLGWAILGDGRLEPEQLQRAANSIERNARLQARLVDDLLDISRYTTGNLRLETQSMELNALVREACDAVQVAAQAKRIAIDVRPSPQPITLTADPIRIRQAIWNLLGNAVKFTHEGGVVSVSTATNDGYAEVSIADNGPGIADEFMEHLFERFRQADGGLKRTTGGLGIGLALVRHIAEAHGGTARAFSAGKGRGATFTITLPLPVASAT